MVIKTNSENVSQSFKVETKIRMDENGDYILSMLIINICLS